MVLPVVLCAAGGLLMGGAWSLRSQGSARATVLLVGAFGLIALLGGVFWMLPQGTFG
jgi:hypothetical protein